MGTYHYSSQVQYQAVTTAIYQYQQSCAGKNTANDKDLFGSSSISTSSSFLQSLTLVSPNDPIGFLTTPAQQKNRLPQEEEKINTKKYGKLMGDGLPYYLTSDTFFSQVVDHEKAVADNEVKQAWKEARGQRAGALEAWKKDNKARKQHNRDLKANYQVKVNQWKEECENAKAEKRQPAWKKPVCGKLKTPLLKPTAIEEAIGDDADLDADEHENSTEEEEE
ncbi:hypothetical protein SERLADRAFT_405484 [Serpula lacrymans var. lacrymans S7.9]|nr:uncharacterized protein SERLADRAFT_405484 [Serpula lacrymans var. lacrymans S7.9]EGO29508.1 hypothetical protein SERLADRAFT_405484 [Serpula lacrymans var. lacrymans S7.9]